MKMPQKIQHYVNVPGTELRYPETVIYGSADGPCVTVSAGVHSREYVGVEAICRLAQRITPESVRGEVHLIHALNFDGLLLRSNDVFPADGKNLNREFPGDPSGSETQRLAAFLEEYVIRMSDAIIDLHSGGGYEQLMPHVYFHGAAAQDVCQRSEAIARCVDVPYIVRSQSKNGFYSHAGTCGVPAIILERGCCGLWSHTEAQKDVEDVENILRYLGVLEDGAATRLRNAVCIQRGFYAGAPVSGCWYPSYEVGTHIRSGEKLGEIRDVFGALLYESFAQDNGVILYQTVSLGIEQGTPMIAYGVLGP